MMPPPGFQIYLRSRVTLNFDSLAVTLNFDSLAPKVERFIPVIRGPLVRIGIQIGLFFLKISC